MSERLRAKTDLNFSGLEICRITPRMEKPLADFFRRIATAGEDRFFHPHPFSNEAAAEIANCSGLDLYYCITCGDEILGYGMLRGWDAGYDIPSLGIIIGADARGTGLGILLMHFLHAAARQRKAPQIRLKVYPENTAALELYRKLGYVFVGEEARQLVGTKKL